MEQEHIILEFDGLCEPVNSGGVSCYGWVLRRGVAVVASGCGVVHRGGALSTNHVAEYTALIRGLEACSERGFRDIEARGDSQLVIRQMTGAWAVRSAHLAALHRRASALASEIGASFRWIRSEENRVADALSRSAYRAATGRVATERLASRERNVHVG